MFLGCDIFRVFCKFLLLWWFCNCNTVKFSQLACFVLFILLFFVPEVFDSLIVVLFLYFEVNFVDIYVLYTFMQCLSILFFGSGSILVYIFFWSSDELYASLCLCSSVSNVWGLIQMLQKFNHIAYILHWIFILNFCGFCMKRLLSKNQICFTSPSCS